MVRFVSQSGEASTKAASSRLSRPDAIKQADRQQQHAEQRLAAVACFQETTAPALHRFAREKAEQHQRQGGADAERQHGQRHLAEILALGGKQRCGAERRPDARAPDRAEQEPEAELAGEARGGEIVEIAAGPLADRPRGHGELLLQSRHEQQQPTPINRIAETVRNRSVSRPMAKPMVATNRPMVVKEMARPTASASGPSRCSLAAVPSTIGTSGSTQGESTERQPARNASPRVPIAIAAL